MLATQADSAMELLSIVATPLLSAGVATTGTPMMLPLFPTALVASPFVVLAVVASPYCPLSLVSCLITCTLLVMLTHCGVQLISLSKRPWLALCQLLTKTLLGRLGCRMLLTLY